MIKISIPIVLFIFIGLGISAQINTDSLLGIWYDETRIDTIRLSALDKISNSLRNTEPDSAIAYAILMKKFADQNGNKKYVARSFELSGYAYENKGMLPRAISEFESALLIFKENGDLNKVGRTLGAIGSVHWTAGEYKESIEFRNQSMVIAEELGDKLTVANRLRGISYGYFQQGQYSTALKLLQRSLKISEELEDEYGISWCTNALGVFYSRQGNLEKALEYYLKGLKINESTEDVTSTIYSLGNIGSVYNTLGDKDKALKYLERSLKLSKEIDDKRTSGYVLLQLGRFYSQKGENEKALQYHQESLKKATEIGDKAGICGQLEDIGRIYINQESYLRSIKACEKSYAIAQELRSLEDQLSSCECLYEANKALGRNSAALAYHEKIFVFEDSINRETVAKNLQQIEFKTQMTADSIKSSEEKKSMQIAFELEVAEKEKSRNMFLTGGILFLMVAIGLFARNQFVRKAKKRIEIEKDRSDKLLLNILPAEIAEELKLKGEAVARDFQRASILFTDFKGFTKASEKLSAADVVAEINTCFKAFDDIVDKYGIEKIKTIGDAYMCAGGLPIPSEESVKNTVLAALEMQAFIIKRKAELDAKELPCFEMRAGIHTGPVVAGIVGVKKFQYDLWGDTVNTASRIESNGEVGQVNISQTTFKFLKDDQQFTFKSRGKIEAKGKGDLEMWFVKLKVKKD